MISVLILTYNEERNIGDCLKSVSWSNDVLVVDSFSSDKTVRIAQSVGVRVLQNQFTNFADQRNFGLEQGDLKNDWVLHLDADEIVSPELQQEMISCTSNSNFDAYRVASKLMFQNRWLRHSGMYPSYQVRLGRRSLLKFIQVGHGQRENLPAERLGTLRNALIHHSFAKGIHDWMEKHNRYSTDEARHFVEELAGQPVDYTGLVAFQNPMRQRRALKNLAFYLPFRPALRFIYMYCLKLGFLDGVPGFQYCRLLAVYEHLISLKIQEFRRNAEYR